MSASDNLSDQQFYHGTRRNLSVGGDLKPGIRPNFVNSSPDHVYLTTSEDEAVGWANSAQGKGRQRVFRVEPHGDVEPDPEGYGYRAKGARIVERTYDNKPAAPSAEAQRRVADILRMAGRG